MSHIKKNFGMTLLGGTPPDTCPMCACKHGPDEPHNQQSLAYQFKFYDEHDRWPTWADAMAHCSAEMQRHWITELAKFGVNVGGES